MPRRKTSPRKRAPRKRRGQFVGDKLFVLAHLVACCCLPSLSQLAPSESEIAATIEDHPWFKALAQPEVLAKVALIGGLLLIVRMVSLIGTWKGQRWAFWTVLLLDAPGVVFAVYQEEYVAATPAALSIAYCGLRLAEALGPRL